MTILVFLFVVNGSCVFPDMVVYSRPSDGSKSSHISGVHPQIALSRKGPLNNHQRFFLHYSAGGHILDVINLQTSEPSNYSVSGYNFFSDRVVHNAFAFTNGGNLIVAGKLRSLLYMTRGDQDVLNITGEENAEVGYVVRFSNANANEDETITDVRSLAMGHLPTCLWRQP